MNWSIQNGILLLELQLEGKMVNTIFTPSTQQHIYYMVHNSMVLNIRWSNNGPQKCCS